MVHLFSTLNLEHVHHLKRLKYTYVCIYLKLARHTPTRTNAHNHRMEATVGYKLRENNMANPFFHTN